MSKVLNPFLLLILSVSFALGVSTLTRGHEWGDDFASYILQAQSILNGDTDKFIERNTFTIFESSVQIGPVAYPWGYPLALTPALLVKGVHALTLKLPGLFFFLGFLLCLFLLTETRLTRTEGLLLVSLFAFNPTLVQFLDYIISDIPFLFAVFLALYLLTKPSAKFEARTPVFSGFAIFLAFFFRTTGIIVLGAYLAHQAWNWFRERDRRNATLLDSFIVAGVFALLVGISSLLFPNGQGSYLQQLSGFSLQTVRENLSAYFFLFAQFFGAAPAWTYVYYILTAFFLVGAWTRWDTDRLLVIFFAFYFAAMVVWPEWQGIRFLFPLLPLFVYFAFQGMKFAVGMVSERYQRIGAAFIFALWLALAGLFLAQSGVQAYANLRDARQINGPFDAFSAEMFEFIREKTPSDSVVVFFKPRALRLFTGRDSIMALTCDRLTLGDYIVLHKNWESSQILPGDIQDCDLPLRDVFENRRFIVYELAK